MRTFHLCHVGGCLFFGVFSDFVAKGLSVDITYYFYRWWRIISVSLLNVGTIKRRELLPILNAGGLIWLQSSCFRLSYENVINSQEMWTPRQLSSLSSGNWIFWYENIWLTVLCETKPLRNHCETKPLRNHCETKPLRNETTAKRDFKRSPTLMIVFY